MCVHTVMLLMKKGKVGNAGVLRINMVSKICILLASMKGIHTMDRKKLHTGSPSLRYVHAEIAKNSIMRIPVGEWPMVSELRAHHNCFIQLPVLLLIIVTPPW